MMWSMYTGAACTFPKGEKEIEHQTGKSGEQRIFCTRLVEKQMREDAVICLSALERHVYCRIIASEGMS